MVNISTDMWESEISETFELKKTLSHCCLKSRLDIKTSSWWSFDIKWLSQINVADNSHK